LRSLTMVLALVNTAVAALVLSPLHARHAGTPACVAPHQLLAHRAHHRGAQVAVSMQQPTLDEGSASFYAEFKTSDAETGDQTSISFAEKEKLYLECLDAYYNEGGKQLLPDDEYERLKTDLNFEGSLISTFSADEIKFILANKRYAMGSPTLNDAQYDALRSKLREAKSPVVLHDVASCSLDTGICKIDLRVDAAKQRLLYFPGTAGALVVICEFCYWTLHIDPFLSILLGAVPSYFAGILFTENIFGQKPLVTQAPCPDCNYLINTYFGDLFNVGTDIIGQTPGSEVNVVCPNCKAPLLANRETMIIQTTIPKNVNVGA